MPRKNRWGSSWRRRTDIVIDSPKAECVHHWVIENANGPLSKGKCKKCRKTQDFMNSVFHLESRHINLDKERA